ARGRASGVCRELRCCAPGSIFRPIGLESRPLTQTTRNGFILRVIHKASANWIGRAVMGVILGLIAISFGIWGIGDIFKGFGTSTVAHVGRPEIRVDTFPQLYQQ